VQSPSNTFGVMKPINLKGGHPVVYHQYILQLVPPIHNIYKNQMLNYNWVTLGDMFRPLNGHPQANLEQVNTRQSNLVNITTKRYQSLKCIIFSRTHKGEISYSTHLL